MRRPIATAAAMFVSAALWAAIVSTSEIYERSSSFVLAAGLLVTVAVSVVGMIAGAARWARRVGLGVTIAMLALGVIFPLSGWSVAAMLFAGASISGLAGTSFEGMIRRRPASDGPPAKAVILTLVFLLAPPVWAVASPDGLGVAGAFGVAVCWGAMAWYGKAARGALIAVRFLVPVALIMAAALGDLRVAMLSGFTAVAVGALAWTVDARIAVHPLAEPGTTVPIPPELAPRDILDAAGIDDRGRRRES